jgi:hypothetical protein
MIARTRNRSLEVVATVAHAKNWSWGSLLGRAVQQYHMDDTLQGSLPSRPQIRATLCVRELICFAISSRDGHVDGVGGKVR